MCTLCLIVFALVPSISPDGSRVAFASDRDGNYDVYTVAADGSDRRQATFTEAPMTVVGPKYSPDGTTFLVAVRERESDPNQDLYVVPVAGGNRERLTRGVNNAESRSWSPDGARIVFNNVVDGVGQLDVMNADGSGQKPITANEAKTPPLIVGGFFPPMRGDLTPSGPPDGQWIAYASDVTGNFEVHLVRPDGSGMRRVTSTPEAEVAIGWRPLR
jgi:Tol biopolymer transport system component